MNRVSGVVIDPDVSALLAANGFDRVPFDDLRSQLRVGRLDPDRNRLDGPIELPRSDAIARMPEREDSEWRRYHEAGLRAIEAGQVGAVVLNGGMATRFGGTAKGVHPVFDGRSFLDFKLSQIARVSRGRVPVLLMNSFATARITADHLAKLQLELEVRPFNQLISLRLTPDGELFIDSSGRPSHHAPGHGDLPFALAASGELDRFIEAGGRVLTVSNVDNLGASLDPVVIGAHLEGGRPMTVELVETRAGDVGGFPAVVDGKLMIVEIFRLPLGFDETTIPVFNTNTFVFDAEVLASPPELDWFAVRKRVGDAEVIQFERLVGQLSEHLEVNWLRVPRQGARSRFVPIKIPDDLERHAADLAAVLGNQGVLEGGR
ncbi:MAG: UTP--glucose-1-phosphate uridylyltransferase [Deltaproteobacteria bacterium]|nr:UTP--glucose-1-phosphate uridylyltransferase [Deltaproteobacteria bacterium]